MFNQLSPKNVLFPGGWSVLRETSAMASVIRHRAGCRHLEKLGGSHQKQVACLKLEAKVCNLLSLFQRVKHLGLFDGGAWHRRRPRWETEYTRSKFKPKVTLARNLNTLFISSVRSSNSHPDLLLITSTTTTPLFQIHTGPQHWTFTF